MHFLGCWHALGPTPPDLSVFPEGRTTHSALHMGGGMQTPPPPPPPTHRAPYPGLLLDLHVWTLSWLPEGLKTSN